MSILQSIEALLSSSVSLGIPLLIATLGAIFAERAGLLNIGMEGMILIGCFAAYIGTVFSGSGLIGILVAVVLGVLFGLFVGLLTLKMHANQSIVGVVFNFFATGFTGFFNRVIMGVSLIPTTVEKLHAIKIPLLSEIPIIGFLFNQNIVVYATFLLVPISAFILFRTNFGLKIRAVGGNAQAADTMGIDVIKIRYLMWIVTSVMCCIAGAYLVLSIGLFSDGMSNNRGYIAMALVVFARWMPWRALFGALVFGFADAFQIRIQALGLGIPYQFLVILPYVLTIVVLVVSANARFVNPSVTGVPYIREGKELN